LFLWKFKIAIIFLLTKGKRCCLTHEGQHAVLVASIAGVYWQVFGWKWALGVVASIYVHEMGHVAMLRRYGIPATAPMFLPGIGAVIRSRFYPKDVVAERASDSRGPSGDSVQHSPVFSFIGRQISPHGVRSPNRGLDQPLTLLRSGSWTGPTASKPSPTAAPDRHGRSASPGC